MKIRHSLLEPARKNPQILLDKTSGGFGGTGRYSLWQHAIGHYHNGGNDPTIAIKYITDSFSRFKPGIEADKQLELYLNHFWTYREDFERLNHKVVKTASVMDMDISFGNRLGGRLNRIDESEKSMAGYLMMKERSVWAGELRFPVIQHYIAQYFNRKISEVKVGVYCLENGKHETIRYSQKDIDLAIEEVRQISSKISSNI